MRKISQDLLLPINLTFSGIFVTLILLRLKRNEAASRLLICILVIVYVTSSSFLVEPIVFGLENTFANLTEESYPSADAIVVLDGSTTQWISPRLQPEEVEGTRLTRAARLFKAGKAPCIVVSGGLPYIAADGHIRTDADDMFDILVREGVEKGKIVKESASRTTRENAQMTANLLRERGLHRVLLVTSAFHLKRATLLFRETGLEITPVPADYRVAKSIFNARLLVPHSHAMDLMGIAIHEYVGYFMARAYSLFGG